MTPSLLLLYITASFFAVLFIIFTTYLVKTFGINKAKASNPSTSTAVSKNFPPPSAKLPAEKKESYHIARAK